jgi:hypothetical protein
MPDWPDQGPHAEPALGAAGSGSVIAFDALDTQASVVRVALPMTRTLVASPHPDLAP